MACRVDRLHFIDSMFQLNLYQIEIQQRFFVFKTRSGGLSRDRPDKNHTPLLNGKT
jgi:hypothetical protein